ncbi:MAG TPA: hypothetical protein VNT92_03870 [Acidimicrobiia bacterium]|nr:hypothetical protein [Acidimicrobiia bacterium]
MTHDQIDRIVRKANPVRDPNTLGSVDAPVLATQLERGMEMQIDDIPTEVKTDRNRRRGPIVGIAAAAVILVAGLVFFLTRDNTPVAEPAPNATRIDSEPLTPLSPGAYFVDSDGDESTTRGGTFVIEGTEWSTLASGAIKMLDSSYVSLLVVEVERVWSQACQGGVAVQAGTSAKALANQFDEAGLTIREALAPVTAFGHDGYHLIHEVPAGCDNAEGILWAGAYYPGRDYQAEGQVVEYWFLDVEGIPVMVEATWWPNSPEEDVTELRTVLDTLVITP